MKVRIHNSIEKNLIFKDRVQDDKRLKPKGLWYGIDNEWLDWCNEMPGWIHQHNYTLKLDMSKILLITNSVQLDRFTDEYKIYPLSVAKFLLFIDWKKIALKYSGIEINPYLWERRLDMNSTWYYGWDCASGCVWNKEAVLSCVRVGERGN